MTSVPTVARHTKHKLKFCAYCGGVIRKPKKNETLPLSEKLEREHVIPDSIYPEVIRTTDLRLLTIDACGECNDSFVDDETDFRNLLPFVAGVPNAVAQSLFETTMRSLREQPDRRKRWFALQRAFQFIDSGGKTQVWAYPAKSRAFMRICKKIIRGLCWEHGLPWPVPEERVWSHVQTLQMPEKFETHFVKLAREEQVIRYWFWPVNNQTVHSYWLLTFLGNCTISATASAFDCDRFPVMGVRETAEWGADQWLQQRGIKPSPPWTELAHAGELV